MLNLNQFNPERDYCVCGGVILPVFHTSYATCSNCGTFHEVIYDGAGKMHIAEDYDCGCVEYEDEE